MSQTRVLRRGFCSNARSDDHGNKGAILEYGLGNVMNIKQFSAVEHPYNLPNFGNVLSWSLPFVAEKCADFITALHKMELEEEEDELEQQEHTEQEKHNAAALAEIARRREVIKNKVLAMGKMQMMFATLRKEKEVRGALVWRGGGES